MMLDKNTFNILISWCVILIVPAIVIIILYSLFGNFNFFSLSGYFKGVVASGPIAAYIFFVLVGYNKIFKEISKINLLNKTDFKHITGKWNFESQTMDKKETRNGFAKIFWDGNSLKIEGDFYDSFQRTGEWRSIMSHIAKDELVFYYKLEVLNTEYKADITYKGVCTLRYNNGEQHVLDGKWQLLGTNTSGFMKLTRIHK